MAKKSSGGFDDFDIDNMDMGFDDDMPDPFNDNRDPVTKFKANFYEKVKSESRSVSYYNKILKKALPKDYEDILDQLNGAYNKGEELYNNSAARLKPSINAMKRGTKNLLGNSEKYLPKGLHEKLKNWAESSDEYVSSSMSPEQQRDAQLSIELTDVFSTQIKEGARQFEENKRRDLWRTAIDGKRHKRNMEGLEAIRSGIGRLVGYQDNITIKYQRKSLELQYRQLYATRDQTEVFADKANKTLEALGFITKNTSLPDAVKLRNTEAFGAQLRERFISKIQHNTMGGIEGVVDRITKNAKRMLDEKIDQFSMAVDMASQVGDASEMMGGRSAMAGNMAGEAAMNSVANLLAGPLGKFLKKNRKIAAGLARGKAWMNNAGGHASNFSNSSDETDYSTFSGTIKAGFIETLKDLLRDTNRANITHSDQTDYLSDASPFTMQTRKSITDVIPGFLARILREVTILRTKDESTPLLMYNYRRAKFTDRNKVKKSFEARLSAKEGVVHTRDRAGNVTSKTSTRGTVDGVIAQLDKKNQLSSSAKEALRLQLVENSFRGEGFIPEKFAKQQNYHNSIAGTDRQELAAFMTKKFKIGTSRKLGEGSHIDKLAANVSGRVDKLSSSMAGILEEIHLQLNNGNVEILEEMGFMHYKGDRHELNMDAIRAFILGMGEDGDAQTNSTNPSANPNGTDSNGPNYRFVNNRTVRNFRRILSNYNVSDQRRDPVELFRDAANNAYTNSFNQVRDAATKVKKTYNRRDQIINIGKKKTERAFKRTKEQMRYQATLIKGELYNKYPELGNKVDSAIEQLVKHGATITDATRQVAEEVNKDPKTFINKYKEHTKAYAKDKTDNTRIYSKHYAGKGKAIITSKLKDLENRARIHIPDAMGRLDSVTDQFNTAGQTGKSNLNLSNNKPKYNFNTGESKFNKFPNTMNKGDIAQFVESELINIHTAAQTSKGEPVTQASIKLWLKDAGGFMNKKLSITLGRTIVNPLTTSSKIDRTITPDRTGDYQQDVPELLKAIHTSLEDMKELLQAGIHVNAAAAGADGRKFGFRYGMRSGMGKLLSGGGALLGSTVRMYGGALDIARRGVMGVIGKGMTLTGKMFNGITTWSDIYVSGERSPALFAKAIRDGFYTDVKTGKIIKKVSDITGEVKDNTGNIVLSNADFAKGLYDVKGKPVLRNIANKLVNFYGHLLSPIATMFKFANKAMQWTYGKLTQEKDVYVKSDLSKPRLRVAIMQGGGYFSKHNPNKVISTYKDIDGAVVDRTGNEVLSDAEIQEGLCDVNGKPISTLGDKVWNVATWGIRKSFGLAKGLAKYSLKFGMLGVKALAWGAVKLTNFFGRGLNLKPFESISLTNSNTQVTLLTKIRDILEERLPKRKKVTTDTDGDGDRDGSWQDQQAQNAKIVEQLRAKAENAGKAASGLFSGLVTKIKGLIGKKDEESGEDDTTILGGLGGGNANHPNPNQPTRGRLGRVFDKVKQWGRKIPGASKIASGAAWLGRGALAVGGAAMSIGGLATIGSWLATAAGAIGTAALAVISSPVFLGALAVTAVVGAGYLAYKYFSKPGASEFRNIRLAQYGVDPKNEAQAGKVFNLEKAVSQYIKLNGTTATLELSPETLKKVSESFGVSNTESGMRGFTTWLNERFKPIYIAHRACAEKLSPRATLDEMDSKFIKAQKLEAIGLLDKGLDWAPYKALMSPFEGYLSGTLTHIRDAFATARTVFATMTDDGKVASISRSTVGKSTATAITASSLATSNKNADGTTKSLTQLNAESRSKLAFGIKGAITMTAPTSIYSTKNAQPSSMDIVRFKAYGLIEMDTDKVKTLREMERSLIKLLAFSSDGVASLTGSIESFLSEYTSMFGIGMDDSRRVSDWTVWFNKRFLPVFLAYCTAVRKADRSVELTLASTYLKPDSMLMVAQELVGVKSGGLFSSSVWGFTQSPWLDYTLNNDSGTTAVNIAVLEQMVKNRKYTDDRMQATTDALLSSPRSNKPSANILQEGGNNTGDTKPTIATVLLNTKTEAPKNAPLIYPTTKGTDSNKYGSKDYMMPSTGRISSIFGDRDSPMAGASTDHKGIDIAAPNGTPVMSCADGNIVRREFSSSYGNVIYIKHLDGKCSRYAHLSSFQPGQFVGKDVSKGDIIGYVGSTGNSTGNHLHFEIRETSAHDARPLDPLKVIGDSKSIAEIKELKGYSDDSSITPDVGPTGDTGKAMALAASDMSAAMQPKVTSSVPISNVSTIKATTTNTEDTGYDAATQTAAIAAQQTRKLVQERNKASDIKSTTDITILSQLLEKSYNVQVEMRDELKKLNVTMMSQKDKAVADVSTGASKPGKRPTETAMRPNPVSVKKIEVA